MFFWHPLRYQAYDGGGSSFGPNPIFVFWHMQLYISWYIRSFFGFTFLNILYFFKYSCTNIFIRRSLYTFYEFFLNSQSAFSSNDFYIRIALTLISEQIIWSPAYSDKWGLAAFVYVQKSLHCLQITYIYHFFYGMKLYVDINFAKTFPSMAWAPTGKRLAY